MWFTFGRVYIGGAEDKGNESLRFEFYFAVQMDGTKKNNSTMKKKRQSADDPAEQQNILQQCLNILEYLFKYRLIEKIARPIDKKVRQEKITQYGEKLFDLHQRLFKIKNEIVEMSYNENPNNKNKSVLGQVTNKPSDWRKIIRNIEAKYNEVLIDGSYKYFKRVCMALGLRYQSNKMETIGIEEWAAQCLDTKPAESCC